jgi:FXSXX-COOH protein
MDASEDQPGATAGSAGPEAAGPAETPAPADVDLLGMDLETLRTTEHPVLAELLIDLRERLAAPGTETLWAFDNVSTSSERS